MASAASRDSVQCLRNARRYSAEGKGVSWPSLLLAPVRRSEEILALFDVFSPTGAGMGRRALGAGTGPVGFELTMARKDVRLMLETAGSAKLTVLPSIARAMDDAIAAGHGAEDFAILGNPKR